MAGAVSRAAIDHPAFVTPITEFIGLTVEKRRWEIAACCAQPTTSKCICKGGTSPSGMAASNSSHPRSSILIAGPSPTHFGTDRDQHSGGSGGDAFRFGQLHVDGGLCAVGQLHRGQFSHVARAAQVSKDSLNSGESRS
jgi:hypothetical protein